MLPDQSKRKFAMSSQDAFITLLNASIATAIKHKQTALSLIERAETAQNKRARIASEAAAYRADKAVSVFKQALEFQRETNRSTDLHQTGLEHLDVCERQLNRATDLFFLP
jgi:uncharacterized protein YacL (UPF0231 family)